MAANEPRGVCVEGPPEGPEPTLPVWTGRLRIVGGTDTQAVDREPPQRRQGARQEPFRPDPTQPTPAG
jgi:hypothetical protein